MAENTTESFSSEKFIETNNIFALRGENLFLFHCVREGKKINRVKLPCTYFRFPEEPFP